jgi:hypothetical protein
VRPGRTLASLPEGVPAGPLLWTPGDGGAVPISRDDFKRGISPESDEEKVVRLLREDPGQAFTSQEIARLIGHRSAGEKALASSLYKEDDMAARLERRLEAWEFRLLLDSLVHQGKIERRRVKVDSTTESYYAARA